MAFQSFAPGQGGGTIQLVNGVNYIYDSTTVSWSPISSTNTLALSTVTTTSLSTLSSLTVNGAETVNAVLTVSKSAIGGFTGTTSGHVILTDSSSTLNNWTTIDFNTAANGNPISSIGSKYTSSGTYLAFGTSNNYTNGITNQAMTIDYNGNVGIGITTPNSLLQTQYASGVYNTIESGKHGFQTQTGTTASDYTLFMGADRTNGISYIQSVNWGINKAPLILNGQGGNVGIGNISPTFKLDITAGALGTTAGSQVLLKRTYSTNGNAQYSEITNTRETDGSGWTGSGTRIQEKIDATWMAYIQFNGGATNLNNGGISFGTGTTTGVPTNISERVRIEAGGNVGIGTKVPGGKLHVFSSTSEDGIRIDAPTYPEIVFQNASVTRSYIAYSNSGGGFGATNAGLVFRSENGNLTFLNSSSYQIMSMYNNNVGIGGITSPAARLEVRNSGAQNVAYFKNWSGTPASPTEVADWPWPVLSLSSYGNYYKQTMLSFSLPNDGQSQGTGTYHTDDSIWNISLNGVTTTGWDDNSNTTPVSVSSASVGLQLLGPGNLRLGTSGAKSVIFRTNGTDRFTVDSGGTVAPAANNTYNLGNSSFYWKDFYTTTATVNGTTTVNGTINSYYQQISNGTANQYVGMSLTNRYNDAVNDGVSFIDSQGRNGITDSSMFFGHRANYGSWIGFYTQANSGTNTDRRTQQLLIENNGTVYLYGGSGGMQLAMRNGGDLVIYNADNSGGVTLYCDTNQQLNISNKLYCPGVTVQTVYVRSDAKSGYSVPATGGIIISDLNITITPRSTSSKIKVTFNLFFEVAQQYNIVFRLYRNIGGAGDVLIGMNANDGNTWAGTWIAGYDANDDSTPTNGYYSYLDSPSTTSAVTYKLVCWSSSAAVTFYLNRSYSSTGVAGYEVGISQSFAEEIAQ